MPDDDKIHPLPASRGLFPLYNVEAFASQLPERITKRGGILFPMWQREAPWIQFNNRGANTRYAIRVNIGHINAVSGLDIYEVSDKQDYLVVPGQKWLDGISVSPGVVRQFVAMPLGAGYTVEGQVSGKEKFGGIQIEVIPSYEQYTHAFRYSTEGRVKYAAEYDTPGDYALKDGDKVTMAPKSFRYTGLARLCDILDDGESFEGIESLHLKSVYIRPDEGPASRISHLFASKSAYDFEIFDCENVGSVSVGPCSGVHIVRGGPERETPRAIRQSAKLIDPFIYDDVVSVSAKSCSRDSIGMGGPGLGARRAATEQASRTVDLREMGIAAGGKLVQDIVQDSSQKGIWDTARTRLLDIHILQPSDFEAVTHIVPPRTPITIEEYIEAGIAFYAVEEDPDQRLDGPATLAGIKSISAMDNEVGVNEADTDFTR